MNVYYMLQQNSSRVELIFSYFKGFSDVGGDEINL